MKVQPSVFTGTRKKIKYSVTIEDEVYDTWAFNEEGAIANAAFRYGFDNDEDVKLVMWKIREEQLYCNVEEF
jgi:hypothetical protein